jgi:hypothetical protein
MLMLAVLTASPDGTDMARVESLYRALLLGDGAEARSENFVSALILPILIRLYALESPRSAIVDLSEIFAWGRQCLLG